MPKVRTFYDELGVARTAETADIKRAFREVAKRYHPDLNPAEKKDWAHEQMSRLNFIVETLLDRETRAEYDGIVAKYERETTRKPSTRARRQEYALQREYARVSVELMNLTGRYSNWSLKMAAGAGICVSSLIGVGIGSLMSVEGLFMSFGWFTAMVGAGVTGLGLSDRIGRGRFRQRIEELESRQSHLRRRMYQAWTT